MHAIKQRPVVHVSIFPEPILPGILYDIENDQRLQAGKPVDNGTKPSIGDNRTAPDSGLSETFYQEVEGTTARAGVVLAMKPAAEIVANVAVGSVVDR